MRSFDVLTFFFITTVLNLALGYGLALYLGNPLATQQPESQNEEEKAPTRSEEEIHKLLNAQVEPAESDHASVEEVSEPAAVPEPTQTPAEPATEASAVEPTPQPPLEKEPEEVATVVAEPEATSEPAPATSADEASDEAELTEPEEESVAETPAPDIAAWQEQLREQAEKNQMGQLADALAPRASSIDEQKPTLEEFAGSQDQSQPESAEENASDPEATEPEAEVLAGIEAFQEQLSANLPPAVEPQSNEQQPVAAADSLEPNTNMDLPEEDVKPSDSGNEEQAPEQAEPAVAEVENVDADVMAGIDAFRQQLAAMRGE